MLTPECRPAFAQRSCDLVPGSGLCSAGPGAFADVCAVAVLRYMKGRVTYDQLNAAVLSINTAAKAKYRILQQPLKSLNNHSRKLQTRFKEQETKDTKGASRLLPEARRGERGEARATWLTR